MNSQDEPDLEVEISQPFWVFLEGKEEIKEELEIFSYLVLTAIPSHLFELAIENSTIKDYNVYILNSDVLEFFEYDLSGNETLLTTTYENDLEPKDITANFVLQSELSNSTITGILNQTSLYCAIFGSRNNERLSPYANTSLVMSETYFSNLLSSINEEELSNITQDFLTYSYYTFSWNKSEYINSIPSKLLRRHEEWTKERMTVFLQIYIPNYVRYEEFNVIANQLFSNKIEDVQLEMNSILISTIIILFFFSLASIVLLFQLLRSRISTFNDISLLFSSRGFKEKSLRSRFLLLQNNALLSSTTMYFGFALILLYFYELITWKYSYLIVGVSTGTVFFSLLTMQIKLVQSIDMKRKAEEAKKSSRSKSQIIDFGLKVVLGLIAFIALTSILSFNQWFLNIFSITLSSLWTIAFSIGGVMILLFILPTLISKFIVPLTKIILRKLSHLYTSVSRLFDQLTRQRKTVWTSIFLLQMFFSLIIIGPNLFVNHQEQTELSSFCYNVSLIVETESATELQDLVGNKPSMIAYIEPHYISQFQTNDIYIYLKNPLSFFNGIHFFSNYFKKRSSSQVFSMLNSSEEYFVTTSQKAREGQFSIGDLVSLYKKDANDSIVEEKKILLDIADFLPFFSILFEEGFMNIFLMKYNESTHILSKNHYAIFSFQAEQETEESALFAYLKEKHIMFNVIHSFSQTTISSTTQLNPILKIMRLPIYFLMVLIPGLVLVLLFDVSRTAHKAFSYLIKKGFRRKKARFLTFYWSFFLSIFLTSISFIYSILVLLPMIFILNLTYIMPMQLTINWISFSIAIPILFSILILSIPLREDSKITLYFKKKGVDINE
jgi:hypothetical protein